MWGKVDVKLPNPCVTFFLHVKMETQNKLMVFIISNKEHFQTIFINSKINTHKQNTVYSSRRDESSASFTHVDSNGTPTDNNFFIQGHEIVLRSPSSRKHFPLSSERLVKSVATQTRNRVSINSPEDEEFIFI